MFKIDELHSWESGMSPNIKLLEDSTVRAEVAMRRTFSWTVKYPQWKKKCRDHHCYVSGNKINIQCIAVGL